MFNPFVFIQKEGRLYSTTTEMFPGYFNFIYAFSRCFLWLENWFLNFKISGRREKSGGRLFPLGTPLEFPFFKIVVTFDGHASNTYNFKCFIPNYVTFHTNKSKKRKKNPVKFRTHSPFQILVLGRI